MGLDATPHTVYGHVLSKGGRRRRSLDTTSQGKQRTTTVTRRLPLTPLRVNTVSTLRPNALRDHFVPEYARSL